MKSAGFNTVAAHFFLLLMCGFISNGCDNKSRTQEESSYQLLTTSDGKIYRLNKKNGQVSLIDNDKIIPVQATKEEKPPAHENDVIPTSLPEEETVAPGVCASTPDALPPAPEQKEPQQGQEMFQTWEEQLLPGKNLKAILKTRWQEDKIYYEFEVFPYASLKQMMDKKEQDVYYQRKWHGFIIKLLNAKNDVVIKIPLKLWEMDRTFDESGRFASMKAKGKNEAAFSFDEYEEITGYKVEWKLDRILIPDYKFKDKVEDLIDTYNWYGEVDRRNDADAPLGAKYWWITFPDKKKIYFSTEEELLQSYKETTQKILENMRK